MDNIYIADWYTEDKNPGELTMSDAEYNITTTEYNYETEN